RGGPQPRDRLFVAVERGRQKGDRSPLTFECDGRGALARGRLGPEKRSPRAELLGQRAGGGGPVGDLLAQHAADQTVEHNRQISAPTRERGRVGRENGV